jgi:hypothetical protein
MVDNRPEECLKADVVDRHSEGIMKSRTIFLPIGRVAPGMMLAAAVLDKDRNILLAADTELDTRTLDRLTRRGIEVIAVLLPDTRDAETIEQEVRSAESRVAHIFRGSGSPARESLNLAVLQYRQESTR